MDQLPLSRIAVETEPDWLRVRDNVSKGIMQVMEARLSSLPGGKEGDAANKVRKELEGRLTGVQEEMFRMAKPNLRVNGHNYEDFVDATEPFDEILDRRIWSLDAERLEWDTTIAQKRKRTPGDIYRLEEDLERRQTGSEYLPEGEDEEEDGKTKPRAEDIPAPPRHNQVIETFNSAVANLNELATSAPAQLARAQRAQAVRGEIANMPS